MKSSLKIILVTTLLILSWLPALPVLALSPDEEEKISSEAAVKALLKVGIISSQQAPTTLERIQAKALDMPPVDQAEVKWQALMKNYSVQDIRFIAPNRLLLTQAFTVHRLIDSTSGEVVWQYFPEGRIIRYHSLVAAFSDLVIIRDDNPREQKTALAAMSGETGRQLWYVEYPNKKRTFQFQPVPAAGIILAVELEKKKVTVRGLDLFSGQEKWLQKYKVQKGGHPSPPKVAPGGLVSFYGHTRRLDPATGKTLWERKDVVPDNLSPPPIRSGKSLWIVDAKEKLEVLDLESGRPFLTAQLDSKRRYTNIYPAGESLFLRAQEESGAWLLARHDRASGKQLWSYRSSQATVSNIIEDDGRIYVATAAKVLCLDGQTGKELFASPAALTGQSFPVRLRKYGSSVVYIGELFMAGFDAVSGKRSWKVGMTPLSQEVHLDALDNWMSVLQKRIGRLSKAIWFGGAGGAGDAFSSMAANSQNLSNSYWNDYRNYSLKASDPMNTMAESDGWKAANASNLSVMNSAFARAEAQLSFFFSMEGLKNAMLSKSIASDKSELERLGAIRNNIIAAYTRSESGDYAWRPHLKDGWVGIRLVHLPTGRATFTPLSPQIKNREKAYLNERFLWNLVDIHTETVYHPALRIVEDRYQSTSAGPGMTTYGMRLVAEQLKMK